MFSDLNHLLAPTAISLVTLIGFIGIAPKFVSEKLLSHYLDGRLAEQNREHERQIEALKADLARIGDRGVRSNEREFNALSEAWGKFVDAYMSTNVCAISIISHPDLNIMEKDSIENFLNSDSVKPEAISRILAAHDKNKIYVNYVQFRQIIRSQNDIFDARSCLRKSAIFVPAELRKKYEDTLEILSKAQVERHMQFDHERYDGGAIQALLKDGQAIFEDLVEATQSRIFHR